MEKPRLSFWQIWNMSVGFLGIQVGFALQNANVSRIFETLGAQLDTIPILWIAAPTTGLIVQPIIGHMSDRTWNRLGRRRPYFLTGAVLATLALLVMPNSPALWFAAMMLWVMDASINISMEPFRALVADLLPSEQRTTGFAVQSFFIGIGAVAASALPYVLTNWLGISNTAPRGEIPSTVVFSFYIGGIAFIGAVGWTVFRTREYPPRDMEDFRRRLQEQRGVLAGAGEIVRALKEMPQTMRQLALVQFFSWFALFCMWIYTTGAVTSHFYLTSDPTSAAYNEGADWVGVLFAVYNGVAALVAFLIPRLARTDKQEGSPRAQPGPGVVGTGVDGDPPVSGAPARFDGGSWDRVGEHSLDAVRHSCRRPSTGTDGGLHGGLQLLHRHPSNRRGRHPRGADESVPWE